MTHARLSTLLFSSYYFLRLLISERGPGSSFEALAVSFYHVMVKYGVAFNLKLVLLGRKATHFVVPTLKYIRNMSNKCKKDEKWPATIKRPSQEIFINDNNAKFSSVCANTDFFFFYPII